jgi:hypothetical protein
MPNPDFAKHFRSRAAECRVLIGMYPGPLADLYRKMAKRYELLAEQHNEDIAQKTAEHPIRHREIKQAS